MAAEKPKARVQIRAMVDTLDEPCALRINAASTSQNPSAKHDDILAEPNITTDRNVRD